jgi:hypothetical protein
MITFAERTMRVVSLALVVTLLIPAVVRAQVAPAGTSSVGVRGSLPPLTLPLAIAPPPAAMWDSDERAGMPAWLKWGLIGGAGTAAVAALLAGASIDPDPPGTGEAAVRGFALGFVTIGGGVAVYQLICKPGSWSKRNGLCAPARTR